MIICHCKGKTTADITRAAACGARTMRDLCKQTDAGSDCGGCRPMIENLLRGHSPASPPVPDAAGRS